jgi:hypothetical protein
MEKTHKMQTGIGRSSVTEWGLLGHFSSQAEENQIANAIAGHLLSTPV